MRSTCAFLLLCLLAVGASAHPGNTANITLLDQLISAYPQQQALYVRRGTAYADQGQWQLAERDFERARMLGEPAEVDFEQGLMRYRQNRWQAADELLSRYLSLHPLQAQALLYRARTRQQSGLKELALADFHRYMTVAIAPQPGDFLAIAKLLAQDPRSDTGAALILLDQAVATLGPLPQLQRYAISLELERDNIEGALARCATMAMPLRYSPQWQIEMAQLLQQAKREGEATALLLEAHTALAARHPTPAVRHMQYQVRSLLHE